MNNYATKRIAGGGRQLGPGGPVGAPAGEAGAHVIGPGAQTRALVVMMPRTKMIWFNLCHPHLYQESLVSYALLVKDFL